MAKSVSGTNLYWKYSSRT